MEFFDIVDENDNIIERASKKETYEKLLTHRIVHVIVFNKKNEIALQLRSSKVPFCPLHWCTTASGHVRSGETYEEAAKRELKEETGIMLDLNFAYKDKYVYKDHDDIKKFLATFTANYNGQFILSGKEAKFEVDRIEFFPLDKIKKMVENQEKIHPELLFLLKKHFNI